jgi:hypothetical protein
MRREKHSAVAMFLILLAGLLMIVFSGCATASSYTQTLTTWLGHSDTELINAWGPPSRTFNAPNGHTIYTYEQNRMVNVPTVTMPSQTMTTYASRYAFTNTNPGQTIGGYNVNLQCNTWFDVDTSGTIVQGQWQGACE